MFPSNFSSVSLMATAGVLHDATAGAMVIPAADTKTLFMADLLFKVLILRVTNSQK